MGVYYDEERGKWVARASTTNGKRAYLGRFETEKEATLAYDLNERDKRNASDDDVVAEPLVVEQTGSEGRFPTGMVKRAAAWAKDKLQKLRTDGSERV